MCILAHFKQVGDVDPDFLFIFYFIQNRHWYSLHWSTEWAGIYRLPVHNVNLIQ